MKELIQKVDDHDSRISKLEVLEGGGVTTASLPLAITGSNIALSVTPANPGGAVALQATTPGTAQTGNINISGAGIAGTFKGAGSSFPDVGSTTLAEKMGNVYLADGKDLFPDNDIRGLWDRFINWGITPDDHYHQNTETLTWTGFATYTNFVTPAFVFLGGSNLKFAHTAANVQAFRYRAAPNGAHMFIRARVGLTYRIGAGLMIDDGVNNVDGKGANNFYRVYFTQAALGGPVTAVEEYRSGGAVPTVNVGPTMPYGQFWGIKLSTQLTAWTNWTGGPWTIGENGEVLFTGGSVALNWTPTRVGMYTKYTLADAGSQAHFDWYDEALS